MVWTRLIPRIFILLCTLIGSIAVGEYALLRDQGYFDPWIDLGMPGTLLRPDEKADTILGHGMGFVRVGTNQKRAFEIDIPRLTFLDPWQGDFQWVKAPYEVEVIYGPGAKFGCPFVFRAPPLSGRVIDSAQTKNCRLYVGMEQANYALLENGELWVWEKARYNLEYSKWPVIAAWFLGGSLGFVIGSVAVLMIRRLSRKGRRT